MTTIHLKTPAETEALGARLGAALVPGDVVCLTGGLGAGKTTLARGLIQSRHGGIEVPSPTYTLVQAYDWGDTELWHCDLYRLDAPDDAYELGLIDAMDEAIVLLEWPERLGAHLPERVLGVGLAFREGSRTATLTGWEGRNV